VTFCFNNAWARAHARLYGLGAFYDLNLTGVQATYATTLRAGDSCVVATPATDGKIAFDWYAFEREAVQPDETATPVRVLFGTFRKSDPLRKSDAARDARYAVFFDKNGNFKRQSVLHR
jgi:hypothetical protein